MLNEAKDAYEVMSKCHLEVELSHANKGVEGIQYYDAGDQGKSLLHKAFSFSPVMCLLVS